MWQEDRSCKTPAFLLDYTRAKSTDVLLALCRLRRFGVDGIRTGAHTYIGHIPR